MLSIFSRDIVVILLHPNIHIVEFFIIYFTKPIHVSFDTMMTEQWHLTRLRSIIYIRQISNVSLCFALWTSLLGEFYTNKDD